MATDKREVERLTIRLGGKDGTVPVGSFLYTIQQALGVLREIDRELSELGQVELRWRIVAAKMSSPLVITIEGVQRVGPASRRHRGIVDSYLHGLHVLKRTPRVPPNFSDAALENTKLLTSVVGDGLTILEFKGPEQKKLVADKHLAANVEEALKTRYYFEHGTLEGKLEVLDIHGAPKFSIFHSLTDVKTVCEMPTDRVREAVDLFGQRVAVSGEIKFNRHGKPLSMSVENLKPLRQAKDLPKFRDVEGIDFTSGEDVTEYMRKLRDGREKA